MGCRRTSNAGVEFIYRGSDVDDMITTVLLWGWPREIAWVAEAPMTQQEYRISVYLKSLSALCLEAAREPRLLPVFVRIIALAPATLAQLARHRRIAA